MDQSGPALEKAVPAVFAGQQVEIQRKCVSDDTTQIQAAVLGWSDPQAVS